MQEMPSYSTFMKRRGAYSNGMLSEVKLPIDDEYIRLPRKNQVICAYAVTDSLNYEIAWTHYLVFPYKDRTFWSVWITLKDLSEMNEFIHRRIRAYPAGWVEAKIADSPKAIAKFLLINSLSAHVSEAVGAPTDLGLVIGGYFHIKPGFLDMNDVLSSILSIYSGIEVLEYDRGQYRLCAFNTSGLEEAILESTFPEYREGVAKKIYKKDTTE
jgi:hypothetical protein